ncbi:MAG TPA: sulfatase-like hydrolase/transferase, partial [Burkholderiaceae bacterium]
NWGLNGYARQTTPELAQLDVVNFSKVTSCGTNTEVSVPCMFSPYGRASYDEKAIRRHESVLHVLDHAGVKTLWRDNQSGCKGVCDGLPAENLSDATDPALCKNGLCQDEILLSNLTETLKRNNGPLVLVLHQLGNHGPAYSARYPQRFRRYAPTCETGDLGKCTREQIVNSYDNAVSYTDHVVAQAIRQLGAQQSHDAALIYVSDHGESLGENGLYLHGIPYAIAPREQGEVPMAMWLSPGYSASTGITSACLRQWAREPASHDNLFHSMLGMMQVDTSAYQRGSDLSAACGAALAVTAKAG